MVAPLSELWDGESTFKFSSKPTKLVSLSSMRSIFLSLYTAWFVSGVETRWDYRGVLMHSYI